MPNICTAIIGPTCPPRDYEKEVEETIEFARKNLSLNLLPFKEDMLEASQCGQLEFTYLGPGRFEGKEPDIWNCYLTMFDETKYFYALTLYDHRTGENPLK